MDICRFEKLYRFYRNVVAQGAYQPKFGAPFPMATTEPEYAESSSNDRTPIRRDKSQLDTTITKDPV
jgi:hypothetical protein